MCIRDRALRREYAVLGLPELGRVGLPHSAVASNRARVTRDRRRVLDAMLPQVPKPMLGKPLGSEVAPASASLDNKVTEVARPLRTDPVSARSVLAGLVGKGEQAAPKLALALALGAGGRARG
eukprot:5759489-Alexandrium_andersonii.AAC.1